MIWLQGALQYCRTNRMKEIEIMLSRESFEELTKLTERKITYEEYLEETKKKPLKALFG